MDTEEDLLARVRARARLFASMPRDRNCRGRQLIDLTREYPKSPDGPPPDAERAERESGDE